MVTPSIRPRHVRHLTLFATLFCATLCLDVQPAQAQQNMGNVAVDGTVDPITAVQTGGTLGGMNNFTGANPTPLRISESFAIDGTATAGTGYSIIRQSNNSTDVAALLQVDLSNTMVRGNGTYYNATWTITVNNGPGGVDISGLGLNQTALNLLNVLPAANGTAQNMTNTMYTSTGATFSPEGLTVTVMLPRTPEPSGLIVLGMGVLMVGAVSAKCRKR